MTLNRLNNIIKQLDYELKFSELNDIEKIRFKNATIALKLILNDRLGFPLYDEKMPVNASEEAKTNIK